MVVGPTGLTPGTQTVTLKTQSGTTISKTVTILATLPAGPAGPGTPFVPVSPGGASFNPPGTSNRWINENNSYDNRYFFKESPRVAGEDIRIQQADVLTDWVITSTCSRSPPSAFLDSAG